MKSITIIIPYFGVLPPQFPLWWKSALDNDTVNFIFITDIKTVASEKNIKVIHMSFAECKDLVRLKLNHPVALSSPYKLCDLKPCYGLIFSDFLNNCDFWGFGDIDLIYGNLRFFITDDILDKYQYISGFGHLTLMKNDSYWNNFSKVKVEGCLKFEEVMDNPSYIGFDEYWVGGVSDKAKMICPEKVWDPRCFDDLRTPRDYWNFMSECRQMVHSLNLIFEYDRGNIYRIYNRRGRIERRQTLYLHYKHRQNLLRIESKNTEHYLVIPNRIIDYEEVTMNKMIKWTSCSPWYRLYFYYFIRIGGRLNLLKKKLKVIFL